MGTRKDRSGRPGLPLELTRDAQSWRRLWLESKERSPANTRERHGRQAEISRWNHRAGSYARHADSEESRLRQDWVLAWLAAEGALNPGGRVLDIGAGPGNYALPLAQRVAELVALEPAEGMCAILRERIHSLGAGNIRVVQKTWEEANLAASGWRGAFDLVFASMSPGVNSPDTLEKMLAASRGHCYLSGWSGGRWGRWGLAQAELWPLVFAEPLGDYPGDVLYPFGLLYALGFRPSLRFEHPRVEMEMPAGEAAADLAEHFERYVQIDAGTRRIIEDYVARHSRRGLFRQDFHTCQGFMLWRV